MFIYVWSMLTQINGGEKLKSAWRRQIQQVLEFVGGRKTKEKSC